MSTVRLFGGNDYLQVVNENFLNPNATSQDVNIETAQGYVFQSNVFAGAGDDYIAPMLPRESVFKGGTNTDYSSTVLSDDLTLEELSVGDTFEVLGSRYDWDLEFKDGNGDGSVTLSSILDERDYIALANNNRVSGFERFLFGDLYFDLVLYDQLDSNVVYGQPEYFLEGIDADGAPQLNSTIASGSELWEAFRFNRTIMEGIAGTAVSPIDVYTGNNGDTPYLTGALRFANLYTEGGADIAEIGSADQATFDLGDGDDSMIVKGLFGKSFGFGGLGRDNIIVDRLVNSRIDAGADDDVIQVITSASQIQFDGGVGSRDVLLLPGTYASYGLTPSNSGGITTFNDVFGNIIVGFESIKFSDFNLAPLQQLTLAQTPAAEPVNEGATASYAIALSGSSLQSGQSVAFSLQLVDGTAQFLSDLAAISASSLLASSGIVFSNISFDATQGQISAIATTSKAFIAGDTIATLVLPINEDLLAESAETFGVTLRDFTQSQTVTTTINDVAPVSINLTGPALVTEGQSSTYSVVLNAVGLAVGRSVTFTVGSGSGTATEGEDFAALLESILVPSTGISLSGKSTDPTTKAVTVTATNTSGTPLPVGAALLTFQLPITIDSVVEGSETFGVTLTSTTASVGAGLVSTTINDLVPIPTVGLSGVSTVEEGQSAAYAVSLLDGGFLAGQSLTLSLSTGSITAKEGVDFAAPVVGDLKASAGITLGAINTDPITKALTFTATNSSGAALTLGSQILSFALPASSDTVPEENKTYEVSLSSLTAPVTTASVVTTIIDDDVPIGVDSVITAPLDGVILIGTTGNDLLTGNSQANQIYGAKGSDVMTGFLGEDIFKFRLLDGLSQGDQITDFNPLLDKIQLADVSRSSKLGRIFKGKAEISEKGSAKVFALVTSEASAQASKKLLVYDRISGSLYYNENGRNGGFGFGGEIAKLGILVDVQASDILLLYADQPF